MSGIPVSQRLEYAQSVNPLIGTETQCSRCRKVKKASDFCARNDRRRGLSSSCKECIKEKREARNLLFSLQRVVIDKKKCHLCREVKDISGFSKNKSSADGFLYICKTCCNKKEAIARKNNLEKKREQKRNWLRKWRENNPEEAHRVDREWRDKNRDKVKEMNLRALNKKRSTPKGKISHNMTVAIGAALKGAKRGRHWEDIVGYSVDQLKKHLENRFKDGMSWGNYGPYWHIDHIVPIAAFNFTSHSDIDFKKCWSLKNLQPLESIENKKKSAKINTPFQPSLTL